jgi:phosphoglucosamine mutase
MQKFPQVLINIPVREKRDLDQVDAVRSVVQRVEQALGGRGRVYIRYSGTEALARVMVEGQDLAQVETYANDIADAVRTALGTGSSGSTAATGHQEAVAARG